MNPITVFLTVACLAVGVGLAGIGHLYLGIPILIVGIIIASALKMANTWQKFVILRAGKLRGVKGPGLLLIIPVIDHVVAIIDERIQTTVARRYVSTSPGRARKASKGNPWFG
jgi:regulator of protease activity HflC (stomatin/prohibitin superfamily)